MSYSATGSYGSFGALDCPCPACAAPKRAVCQGTERASNCPSSVCCPTSSFNNGTYAAVKGATSLQFWNERRVRHALNYLLSITPEGESTPAGERSYDEFGFVDDSSARLVARIRQAATRYNLLFPANRWYKLDPCKPNDCQSDGFTSCWVARGEYSGDVAARDKAADFLTKTLGADKWIPAALSLIASVHGGAAQHNHGVMTSYASWVKRTNVNPDLLMTVQGGQIVANGWLKQFIDVFAPTLTISSTAAAFMFAQAEARRKAIASPSAIAKAVAATRRKRTVTIVRSIREPSPETPEKSTPVSPGILAAAGVLLVGGGALFVMRRRKLRR